ncbi:sigma-70 family RNA polymerase sigma factor [Marivita sp. GX14005]|uniref:sigma-70 family RNA polymerase sigma factor n=1 Tax=Marivita sp. GX14005 TaxID=2942276 RepID=UPI0020197019|nr:sigma-70 family RNA polymerase sigma factor [Marivita sp. GX14005]MCL3883732.1 sigma-70 family RNA polymerase sigma factor [Marivita sp. GX14005]
MPRETSPTSGKPRSGTKDLDPDQTVDWIPALRAFGRFLTQSDDEADDLVQETLLKAIRHRDKFAHGTNLRAWLFTIMRNTFYNSRAKSVRERTGPLDCVSAEVRVEPTQEWTLRGQEVLAAVHRLPVHYREAFILTVMLGESYESCGEICGITMGTVKSRVNRARSMVIADLGDTEV